MWCVAELDQEYLGRMEDVLALYEKPLSETEPVLCIDEKPVVLHADLRPPRPLHPGRALRRDCEYERRGTANAFCGVEPKAGRHYPRVTPDRSSPEFADYLLEIACLRNLAKTRPLFSQLGHLITAHYPTRTPQRLSLELGVAQPGPDTFLNERAFEFGHCTNNLEHEPTGWGGEIQIVTEADKGHAVRVKISERVDEVLQRPPEAVNFPAKHYIEVPPVRVSHQPIQFRT